MSARCFCFGVRVHHRAPIALCAAFRVLALALALAGALACAWGSGIASAAVAPLKPHGQLVREVGTFLMSDVGNGGIRTMDGLPGGALVPPYFYHYAIQHDDDLDSATSGYPGYASISYPGYTVSVGIDAFLAYWIYSGEPAALARARALADWLVARRTPAGDLYARWPYSTQTNAVMGGGFDGDAIMTDKPAMFALRCLRLYDITGSASYLQCATEIAQTYVATQRGGGPSEDGRWPFRVRPADGAVRQDYTSHLVPAIRLLEQMEARAPGYGYGASAARAWAWLWANPLDSASANYQRWEGFYEDSTPDEQVGLRDHYSAEETVLGLIERGQPGDLSAAVALLAWDTARYQAPTGVQDGWGAYAPCVLEWDNWPNTTYAATGQWAYVTLALDAATRGTALNDPSWRPRAIGALHTLTYGQGMQPWRHDGRMLTTVRELSQPQFGSETWYEQNFNTVKYELLSFAYAPELASADEDHIVGFQGGEPTEVAYALDRIATSWNGVGRVVLRLQLQPRAVLVGGVWRTSPVADLSGVAAGWTWEVASGVCTVAHPGGAVVVALAGATDVGEGPGVGGRPGASAALDSDVLAEPYPSPANPLTTIAFVLYSAGPVQIDVLDARGRHVRTLVHEARAAGFGSVRWSGDDDAGRAVASGVYRILLVTARGAQMRDVVFVR